MTLAVPNPRLLRGSAVVVALIAGVIGCSGDGDQVSNTPRITASGEPRQAGALLTEAEIHEIDSFEGLVATDLDEVPFFENPDPRGPCGGVVPDPPLVDVDGRAFAGETIVIVELVTKRSQASADYVQALQDDARAECGPYESRTNTGATQHVRDVVLLDLDDLGVPAVGWTSTLEVDGQTSHGGALAFADEEHFVYLQVHALAPPTRGTLEALARLAAAGLRS